MKKTIQNRIPKNTDFEICVEKCSEMNTKKDKVTMSFSEPYKEIDPSGEKNYPTTPGYCICWDADRDDGTCEPKEAPPTLRGLFGWKPSLYKLI